MQLKLNIEIEPETHVLNTVNTSLSLINEGRKDAEIFYLVFWRECSPGLYEFFAASKQFEVIRNVYDHQGKTPAGWDANWRII